MKIKFGTDGWRALIAKSFTTDNVARLTYGVAFWLENQRHLPQKVVVGYDCRFGGEMFAHTVTKVFTDCGIKVLLADDIVTTPMLSLAAKELNCGLGIILTASHNPYNYNGYKLKGNYGGPLLPDQLHQIEELVPPINTLDEDSVEVEDLIKAKMVEMTDLYRLYTQKIEERFDLKKIGSLGNKVAFDAMYGSGQFIFRKLLPEAQVFRGEIDLSFGGISPEPVPKNLKAYEAFLKANSSAEIGLVVDGDADRIGLMLGDGTYIDSHHIMLLLVHYLGKYKKMSGEVATGFSTTLKLQKLCKHFGFPLHVVPIGFKHICGLMIERNILMGGEESGGIAVSGHIPERDGIWNGLILLEAMQSTGKSIQALINEIYEITGAFAFHRIDLKLPQAQKEIIVANCEQNKYEAFGKYKVQSLDTMDGFKYYLSDDAWVMIRPSGTEPVLRTYAEAPNRALVDDILANTHSTILNA